MTDRQERIAALLRRVAECEAEAEALDLAMVRYFLALAQQELEYQVKLGG